MKYTNFKTLAVMLSASALLALSGCGTDGIPSDGGFGDTTTPPVVTPPEDTLPGPGELGYQVINADGSITYVDYTEGNRTAPESAAKAEYHTATGYGNTLFDSAENKCQNCHNELYDTWKSSMHGKSWTDPIFQSKMQDFLRTHINKIGEDKTAKGGLVYDIKKFKGAAQTCIKCHAPGAYYAGDFNIEIEALKVGNITDQELADAQATQQTNSIVETGTFNSSLPTSVVAVSHTENTLYKATFQIGHEANQEGINCAFCHSIETPRLMRTVADGAMDGGVYTLQNAMRIGAHGPIVRDTDEPMNYDVNASSSAMNNFFRLWGPEKYLDYAHTPKGGTAGTFDAGKDKDGRYTMHNIDLNGTDEKVHFTGGPYYGPYGVTGVTNENGTDETDRAAHENPHYNKDNNNHFGESGKGLCLSCHQRSAGAALTKNSNFMELCSTQIAVSTGGDNGSEDTITSPKCQKCHMERIEGTVLHKWARPDLKWTLADNDHLTAEFNPDDTTVPAGDNPVRDGWLNSHAFLGASKTGHPADSTTAKIQSGFDASIETSTSADGNTLTVKTIFTNKTAHMFPGAHPMRRVLSRVIVTDGSGAMINVTAGSTGLSEFASIENNVQPLQGKVLHDSAFSPVSVNDNGGSAALSFPGKVADLNGAVDPQKFDGTPVTIPGTDTTLASQTVSNSGVTTGTVANAAIVKDDNLTTFTRIYGHETGKDYNLTGIITFVVRPGFDSNTVESDNRLSPNETETYTLTYDITGLTGVSATYKIYYMQTGANGKFLPLGEDGFLKTKNLTEAEATIAKKLKITEVFSDTK